MPDFKYGGFVISSYVKLLVYLVFCVIVWLVSINFISEPARYFIMPAAAIVISWFFLTYIEQGKRSFFAKGYMVENVITGAVFGIMMFVIPMFIHFALGDVSITHINTSLDVRDVVYHVFANYFFVGIVVYGYLFHIIKSDFGIIPAVIISAVLFALWPSNDMYTVILSEDIMTKIIYTLNVLLTGVAAGTISIYMGDVRSSCGLLCLFGFCERFLNSFTDVTSPVHSGVYYMPNDIFYSVVYTVCVLVANVTIISSIRKQ